MADQQRAAKPATRARLIAHYLPQFHPIPENDEFWGAGFSEWTSLASGRKHFRGHEQFLPGELGFYDLRLAETRISQAALARRYGVEGFLYWHYWFDGRRVLQRPFSEVLESGQPDFPFALAWANHTWTRIWTGQQKSVLIEQTYPGTDDTRRHFAAIEAAFHDGRYIRVGGKPMFFLFRPEEIPNLEATVVLWKELAVASGLGGLHIVGRVDGYWGSAAATRVATTLDAVTDYSLGYLTGPKEAKTEVGRLARKVAYRLGRKVARASFAEAALVLPRLFEHARASYPTALTGWDSTPRHRARGFVLTGRTPDAFETMLRNALIVVDDREHDDRIVFLKSWNEWAEGNYIEPDRRSGRAFLEVCGKLVLGPDQ